MSDGPALYGTDLFGKPKTATTMKGTLAEKFTMPPFTVLNAREGWWQNRKRAWIRLGIQSEIGRGGVVDARSAGPVAPTASLKDGLTYGLTQNPYQDPEEAKKKEERIIKGKVKKEIRALVKEEELGDVAPVAGHTRVQGPSQPGLTHHLTCQAYRNRGKEVSAADCGTSIFDPVICEMAYRWFCPPGGQILDPFSGGSVRGIVAGMLGFRYWGCDLSATQIAANVKQGSDLLGDRQDNVTWINGDSTDTVPTGPESDFVFSCPPYGDLEEYSKDPRDLSTMDYADFREAYLKIILASCERLKDDRFACFVVGDFRDPKTGLYRHFHADTTTAFRKAGLGLYNQAILVTAVGSLSIRVAKQFNVSRKMGMTHQHVLVYVKGDPRKATEMINGASSDDTQGTSTTDR